MATTYSNIIASKYLETTQSAQYTSAGAKTIIDKCTITNVSSSNAVLNVNIVKKALSASDENLVIHNRVIRPNETYLCPELIGVVLESGDFISTLSDQLNALTINASGRLI